MPNLNLITRSETDHSTTNIVYIFSSNNYSSAAEQCLVTHGKYVTQPMKLTYLFFLPPLPDLAGTLLEFEAGSCFLVLPRCRGTSSAIFNINSFPVVLQQETIEA